MLRCWFYRTLWVQIKSYHRVVISAVAQTLGDFRSVTLSLDSEECTHVGHESSVCFTSCFQDSPGMSAQCFFYFVFFTCHWFEFGWQRKTAQLYTSEWLLISHFQALVTISSVHAVTDLAEIWILQHHNKIIIWLCLESQTASHPLIRFCDSSYWAFGNQTIKLLYIVFNHVVLCLCEHWTPNIVAKCPEFVYTTQGYQNALHCTASYMDNEWEALKRQIPWTRHSLSVCLHLSRLVLQACLRIGDLVC